MSNCCCHGSVYLVWFVGVLFYCIAPTHRHVKCAEMILANGADVNNCNATGLPVFLQACETAHENEQLCLMMLEKGADPNSKDEVNAYIVKAAIGLLFFTDPVLSTYNQNTYFCFIKNMFVAFVCMRLDFYNILGTQ